MHVVIFVLLSMMSGCKPAPRVHEVFKADEEVEVDKLATECRPNPSVKGDQIEVCQQSATGLAPKGSGNPTYNP